MKNSLELKEMRSDLISKLEVMKVTAENEERDLTQDENNEMDSILSNIDDMDARIKRAEKIEAQLRDAAIVSGGTTTPEKEDKDVRNYSFQEAMRQAYTGELSGLTKEMDQEARSKARYTGQTYKGLAVPKMVLEARTAVEHTAVDSSRTESFTDQLIANSVLASAGANYYTGVENIKFPVLSGINSGFQPESGGSALTPTGTASSVTLDPKKIISVVNVSNEALVQNASLEAALRRNMAASINATLENALLTAGSDVTNGPASIFTDASAGSTAAFSGATAVALEADVLGNNVSLEGGRFAYLVDAQAYSAIKAADLVSGVSAAYDPNDRRTNGYFTFFSSNVGNGDNTAKDHVLFGDFSKVHIAQFGGLDFLYDPYSNAATGEPRMIVTSLVDGKCVQNASVLSSLIEA